MLPHYAQCEAETWQVLQYSDALDLEFATALADVVPVTLWEPQNQSPFVRRGATIRLREHVPGSRLKIGTFPRMRGYARFPVSVLLRTGGELAGQFAARAPAPKRSVLVCTTPFYASVAEHWPGPVVYWLTDLIARYGGQSFRKINKLDQRMCRAATLVCPNSRRIADYLFTEAGCPTEKCEVLPNATGPRSILPAPLWEPSPLPEPYKRLPRPLAGVIGNLAENTDWVFLQEVMRRTPWLSWLFVGPSVMPIRDRQQRQARTWVLSHDKVCQAGHQPYTELYRFARGVDVGVLPYRQREPTFSGSSTRFYDHLAACHPILATPAVDSLRLKEPLLCLVDHAEAAAQALETLRASCFQDGLRTLRWETSLGQTWFNRAQTMVTSLRARLLEAR